MSSDRFDTVIVGARCAGAPLATHLARGGQQVLLLDAGKLPSDQPISTHFVSPIGVEWLDDLGVGAEVRRLSPPSRRMRLDLDGTTLDVSFQRGRAGHCLRRLHLDRLRYATRATSLARSWRAAIKTQRSCATGVSETSTRSISSTSPRPSRIRAT
jgi:menaquinone-9 beta-reductase